MSRQLPLGEMKRTNKIIYMKIISRHISSSVSNTSSLGSVIQSPDERALYSNSVVELELVVVWLSQPYQRGYRLGYARASGTRPPRSLYYTMKRLLGIILLLLLFVYILIFEF